MFLPCENVFTLCGAEPASRVRLRQRQLVGDLDSLKCAVARIFVKANPAAVCIQTNPRNRESQKSPSRFLNSPARLQIETVKRQFVCREQSPCFQSEKGRDRRATQRHQKRDERINTTNGKQTCQEHDRTENFFRPRYRVALLRCT